LRRKHPIPAVQRCADAPCLLQLAEFFSRHVELAGRLHLFEHTLMLRAFERGEPLGKRLDGGL
jgi:hypothetical protein